MSGLKAGSAPLQRPEARLAQRQHLALKARLVAEMVAAPPAAFADLLERQAAGNPFLTLSRPHGPAGFEAPEPAAAAAGLFAHVLAELPFLVPQSRDRPIALRLVEALDERGYLAEPLPALAAELGLPLSRLAPVLAALQGIEPPGLFARSLAECLGLQLRAAGALDETAVRLLSHLAEVRALGGPAFARRFGLDPERVAEGLARLSRLNATPAAAFAPPPPPALPDLVFERGAGGWSARPGTDPAPRLGLRASAFRTALAAAADAGARRRVRHQWQAAQDLCRAEGLRATTLLALGRLLADRQSAGLDSGITRRAPLTQRWAAAALSVSPATLSRLVTSRHAALGGQLVPLSRFFERPRAGTDATRSEVLAALRPLLAEAREPPWTDAALAEALAAAGHSVTRRRVAKYRALLGLPPGGVCARART